MPIRLTFAVVFSLPLHTGSFRLRRRTGFPPEVFDPIRRRWVRYTPEEAVRQNFLHHCLTEARYPAAAVAIEKGVSAPGIPARFDALVFDARHRPWMLVECKAPEVPLSEETLFQLLRYHAALQCRYWVLYNGVQCFCADAHDAQNVVWLSQLPPYDAAVI